MTIAGIELMPWQYEALREHFEQVRREAVIDNALTIIANQLRYNPTCENREALSYIETKKDSLLREFAGNVPTYERTVISYAAGKGCSIWDELWDDLPWAEMTGEDDPDMEDTK